ncbi:MAG: alkanal monooxygenase [Jatrophihabitantaceae bacterium]|nr:alkanal monooxygenase [Jatrophihabitantaceae bacterium]
MVRMVGPPTAIAAAPVMGNAGGPTGTFVRMSDRVELSVLELASVSTGQSSGDAFAAATTFAIRADEIGYRRLWAAEHHNMASVASTSPPVLLAHLGAKTERIRLGSGGVMLPNHAPLAVAEQVAILEALHPGRIEMGLGRAPGSDQRTSAILRRGTANSGAEDEFIRDIQQLYSYLWASRTEGEGDDGPLDRDRVVAASPVLNTVPEIWILGSSLSSAYMAAAMGLPYAFANHFSGENTLAAVALYRERFQPSELLEQPHVLVTMSALAAATEDEAMRLAAPSFLSFADLRRNIRRPGRTVEEASEHTWSEQERAFAAQLMEAAAIGDVETVHAKLEKLVEQTQANELMLAIQTPDLAGRLRSLELIHERWTRD